MWIYITHPQRHESITGKMGFAWHCLAQGMGENRNRRENSPLSWITHLMVKQQDCPFLLFLWNCHLYSCEYSVCVEEWPMMSIQDGLCVYLAVAGPTGAPCRLCGFQGGSLDRRTCGTLWEFSAINEDLFSCSSTLTLLKMLITNRFSQPHQLHSKSATVSTQINTF